MRVRLEGISQSYGTHRLFDGLTLEIPSGEFFTLLGPSGCGKTTVLRMLAGFVAPDEGRVLFGDRDVTALPAWKRGVGMVFQDYALFPDRSILANVAYGLDARGVRRDEARERALAMLDRVGLKPLADRLPGALAFELAYRPPYDWEYTLAFLERRAIAGVESVAGGAYRRAESLAGQQMGVEALGESARGGVVHCPTGRHHRLDAHVDELRTQIRRQRAVLAVSRCLGLAQVAAIDEHQFRHPAHLGNVAWR